MYSLCMHDDAFQSSGGIQGLRMGLVLGPGIKIDS